jgi:hypothetical protein
MPKKRLIILKGYVYNAEEEVDNTQVEIDLQSQDEFDEDDQDSYL